MAEEKKGFSLNFEDAGELTATRARNKTMMLSPEVTSRFRSQVLEELDQSQSHEEKTRRINLSRSSFLKPSSSSVDDAGDQNVLSPQHIVKPTGGLGKVESGLHLGNETEQMGDVTPNFIKTLDEAVQTNLTPGSNLVYGQEDQAVLQSFSENRSESHRINDVRSSIFPEMPSPTEKMVFKESKETVTEPAKDNAENLRQDNQRTNSSLRLIYPNKKGKLRGFLICYHFNPEGDYFPLYEGRIIVTNEFDNKKDANYLIIADETVDSFHAIMRVSEGKVMVLDQLSETGTKVIRLDGQELNLNGDKAEIGYREKLKFGDVEFTVLLV
ncbi:MAG: FHA domain-containing protein [Nitrososphaerota archaeon]